MEEEFNEYWKKRLQEKQWYKDMDKEEAQEAFKAGYNVPIFHLDFFKYQIGDKTNKGTVVQRYYMEYKNRHGGNENGKYYVFEDDKSFNEFLVEKVPQ